MDSSASVSSPLVVVQANMDKENVGNKASSYISPHTMPKQCTALSPLGAMRPHTAADPAPTVVVDDEWTAKDEAIKQLLESPGGLHWAQFKQWPTDDEAVAIFYAARHVCGY